MKYLAKRFKTFYSLHAVFLGLLISTLLSFSSALKAQFATSGNSLVLSTTLTSPAPNNTLLSVTEISNSFTLTFYKPDFYQLICIIFILFIIILVFIRRTILSKKQIETVNFKLKRKHSKFKSLFDDTSDAMILVKDGLYADANLATLKLFGYSDKKQLINAKVGAFSPKLQPDGTPSIEKINYHFDRCETHGSSRFEWQYQKPNGQILWLEIAITKMVFCKETLIHMACRDIDKIKKLEHQNAIKNMQLKSSNRELLATIENLKEAQDKLVVTEKMAALGALVAGIAHEINTPIGMSLTGISHFHGLTKDIVNDFGNQKLTQSGLSKYLANCEQACHLTTINLEKAATLIRSFKQVAVDQTSEEERTFNVKGYIDEILSSLHSVTKQTQIAINVDCSEGIVIDSYPGALSQIVTNLIMNSVIHGFKHKQNGRINIQVEKSDNALLIIYSDNGVGIKSENLSKIFDPFFTTNRNNGGSGLGLNIIHNLVCNKFTGQIDCKSALNEGTTFTIKLCVALTSPIPA
jgi:PAS domain S-box-containing protein